MTYVPKTKTATGMFAYNHTYCSCEIIEEHNSHNESIAILIHTNNRKSILTLGIYAGPQVIQIKPWYHILQVDAKSNYIFREESMPKLKHLEAWLLDTLAELNWTCINEGHITLHDMHTPICLHYIIATTTCSNLHKPNFWYSWNKNTIRPLYSIMHSWFDKPL
jgi:hypothetical protein